MDNETMKITAVTQDQLIVKDGVPAFVGKSTGFTMGNGEWAVHYDSVMGVGSIEYTDNREPTTFDGEYYQTHFAWLEQVHADHLIWEDEQRALEEAAIAADYSANEPV